MDDKYLFNEDLLCTALNDRDVHIHETRLVSLDDLYKNVLGTTNARVTKVDMDKIFINGKYYVTLDTCYDLLYDDCNKLITEKNFNNVIDFEKAILQFNEHRFTAFFDVTSTEKYDIWIRYKEVRDVLNIPERDDILAENISTYENLSSSNRFLVECKYKHSKFINMNAILYLLQFSIAVDIDDIRTFFESDIPDAFYMYIQKISGAFDRYARILNR